MATEIVDKRDMYSKHFEADDGPNYAHVYLKPVHYKDENNSWQDVDLNIERNEKWEFEHAVVKNNYHAYFNDKTSPNLHLVSFEFRNKNGIDRWINYKLSSAKPSNFTINANKIVYEECLDNVDIEYIVLQDRLKENIILKTPTGVQDFVFTLKMDGVHYEKNSEEYVVFTDIETGETLWNIDAPFMLDADGNRSDGVEYQLGNNGEFDTLTVHVTDSDFLANATYPITIDPTTITQPNALDGKDARVSQYSSGSNYGSGDLVLNSDYNANENFIYFPLDFLNEGVVEKAEIRMWQKGNATGTIGTVGKVIANWNESTVTWNTKPATDLSVTVPVHVPTLNDWAWIDVKSLITQQNFLTNYYGFTMSYGGRDIYGTYIFYSSDTATDISKAPYLYVQYVKRPAIAFHDDYASYFSDEKGIVFHYLDFGTLTAGQTSSTMKVNIKNLCGFPITGLQVWIDASTIPSGSTIEISRSNNPFIAEDVLYFNGTFQDGDAIPIYARIITADSAIAGGNFDIRAKAYPA